MAILQKAVRKGHVNRRSVAGVAHFVRNSWKWGGIWLEQPIEFSNWQHGKAVETFERARGGKIDKDYLLEALSRAVTTCDNKQKWDVNDIMEIWWTSHLHRPDSLNVKRVILRDGEQMNIVTYKATWSCDYEQQQYVTM